MTYDELMETISQSTIEDWLYDDSDGRYIFRRNISITMRRDTEDDANLEEEWVERFIHHPTASRLRIYICYNGITIEIFYTASVDGASMNIPYPRLEDMTISRQQYNIGRIVNLKECASIDRYDKYISIAGITVRE